MYGEVSKVLALPEVVGVFKDAASTEFFCIALEDLNHGYAVLDQATGVGFDDMKALFLKTADLHAHFWESPLLSSVPYLSLGQSSSSYTPWFESWYEPWLADPEGSTNVFVPLCANPPFNADPYQGDYGPNMRKLIALLNANPHGFVKAAGEELSKRPRTLLHGDLRSENIFKAKAGDPAASAPYKFIDWQCLNPGPGGVDFVQLCTACMQPPEDYARLEELLQAYHTRLGEIKPEAAAAYPYETMKKDYVSSNGRGITRVSSDADRCCQQALGSALIWVAFIGKLTPIMAALAEIPDHPFHGLVTIGVKRMLACFSNLKMVEIVEEFMEGVPAEEGVPPTTEVAD